MAEIKPIKPTSNLLKGGLVGIVLSASMFSGFNMFQNHNVRYQTKDKVVARKVDGLFAYTELTQDKDGYVVIYRNSISERKSYENSAGDSEVDRVQITSLNIFLRKGVTSEIFQRKTDYEEFPHIFTEADTDYQAQLKRFE